MTNEYNLLIINDTSTRQTDLLRRRSEPDSYVLNIDYEGYAYLRGQMKGLIAGRYRFRNCVFTTHGSPGSIYFGSQALDADHWYMDFFTGPYRALFPYPQTKLYFAGCNVGDGEEGWHFLAAAARSLLSHAGGTAMAWTSVGFGTGPVHSGHAVHLWGDTRQVSLVPGGDALRFYENWEELTDGQGNPQAPIAIGTAR